jgi:hypothetical protein
MQYDQFDLSWKRINEDQLVTIFSNDWEINRWGARNPRSSHGYDHSTFLPAEIDTASFSVRKIDTPRTDQWMAGFTGPIYWLDFDCRAGQQCFLKQKYQKPDEVLSRGSILFCDDFRIPKFKYGLTKIRALTTRE